MTGLVAAAGVVTVAVEALVVGAVTEGAEDSGYPLGV